MINVSDNAAKQIARLKSEDQNLASKSLRVKAVKGGCSGMSYKLDFESHNTPQDKVFESNGVSVIIDTTSYLYLIGMTLDFEGGLNGQGFVFQNPNAKKTCSCGSSFGV